MKLDPSDPHDPADVEFPAELDALFESARTARPSAHERARVLSALGSRASSPMRPGLPAGLKVALALAALGVVAAGLWLARAGAPQEGTETPPRPEATEEPEGQPVAAAIPPASTEPSAAVDAPSQDPQDAREPTHTEPSAAPAPDPELPSEEDLIDRAQRSLPDAPDRSLRLLTRHARLYPDGVLAQEREALAISALVQTRDLRAARARLTRFERAWPSSPHLRRLRDLLAPE